MLRHCARLVEIEQAEAQVEAALGLADAAKRIAGSTVPPSVSAPPDIVDLSAEMVNLIQAKNAFTANANVARATSDMEQSLLNVLA